MFWMDFADANPITFWMLFMSLLGLAVAVAAALGERPRRKRRHHDRHWR